MGMDFQRWLFIDAIKVQITQIPHHQITTFLNNFATQIFDYVN